MHRFVYRSVVVLAQVLSISNRSAVQDLNLFPSLGFIQNARSFPITIKFFSTGDEQIIRNQQNECSSTVSYLVNSCGLSPESAKSVAKKVKLQSSKQPDSVLFLLKNRGFTYTQISKIIRLFPHLLLADPERFLLPKVEFFNSIGVTDAEFTAVCSQSPSLLCQSLENLLIPNYNFLKTVLLSDENVCKVFRGHKRSFNYKFEKLVPPKLAVLRELGMPKSYVTMILTCYLPVVLQIQGKFDENVKKVIEMGFDPQKCEFIHAMHVFACVSQSTLERKWDVFRKWGWSDENIRLSFRKYPKFMKISETKLVNVLNFLINKMGWQPSAVAQVPVVFTYSFEKRIIPRCSVMRVLLLNGSIKEENKISLSSLAVSSNKRFLEKFVTKYQDQVPQLLNFFNGKMTIGELGLGF